MSRKRKEPRVKNKQAKKLVKDRIEIELTILSIASKVKIALPIRNNKLPIKIKLSDERFFINQIIIQGLAVFSLGENQAIYGQTLRPYGVWQGKVQMSDDFDILPDAIAAAFAGEME